MSNNGSLVACVDLHDEHNVYVFDVESGALKFKDKGDTSKIFDLCFTDKPGDNTYCNCWIKTYQVLEPRLDEV